MISKLPRWVWLCGWILAFIAGMINAVGFIGIQHQPITHLTGNTTMFAVAATNLDFVSATRFCGVLASFVGGACVSGFIVQDSAMQLGRRYGVVLFLEAVSLTIAGALLNRNNLHGLYFAVFACGLQNAMATTYSGTVIRTTHVSGMWTDLGIFLGHALRGLPVDAKRGKMCFLIISGFFFGGVGGVIAFRTMGFSTLYIPAGITAAASVGYAFYQMRCNA